MPNKKTRNPDVRCERHPDFNPFNKIEKGGKDCVFCHNLKFGTRKPGFLEGEMDARNPTLMNKRIENVTAIKLGPVDLAKFGELRQFLKDGCHKNGNAWYANTVTQEIFLQEEPSSSMLKSIKKITNRIYEIGWVRI